LPIVQILLKWKLHKKGKLPEQWVNPMDVQKTNGTRKLNKNEMKGMAGGFDFSKLGALGLSLASFLGQEAMKFGPEIFQDGMKHFKNKK